MSGGLDPETIFLTSWFNKQIHKYFHKPPCCKQNVWEIEKQVHLNFFLTQQSTFCGLQFWVTNKHNLVFQIFSHNLVFQIFSKGMSKDPDFMLDQVQCQIFYQSRSWFFESENIT